MSILSKQVS